MKKILIISTLICAFGLCVMGKTQSELISEYNTNIASGLSSWESAKKICEQNSSDVAALFAQWKQLESSKFCHWEKGFEKFKFSDEDKNVFSFAMVTLLKLMAPTTVHLTEELYHAMGGQGSIHETQWPEYDEKLAKTSAITLVVQINGKVKDKIEVDSESSKEELEKAALQSEKIKENIEGKQIIKTIVVPGRLVNIVVK